MRRLAMGIALLGSLAACSTEKAPAPAPEPTYASPKAAEEAIPANLRVDYQRLLECEMSKRARSGAEITIDAPTVVALTKRIKAGERAPTTCR